jgi:uncharacterized protein (TIGR00297 family)
MARIPEIQSDVLYAVVIACLCVWAGFLTWDGGIAAAVVGGLTWEAGGWKWALPLLTFFLTSVGLSLWQRERKQRLGLGSPKRKWRQVMANGGVPALMASLSLWSGTEEPWFGAALAGLACANADTWATEIGSVLGKRFFFLPSLKPARAGEEGAVSLTGLVSALGGSLLVAGSALPWSGNIAFFSWICLIGFLGSVIDSLLGSTYEARGKLSNDAVNLLSTGFASCLALCVFIFLSKT